MPEELRSAARRYAAQLDALPPGQIAERMAEVAGETALWDRRTEWFLLGAEDWTDLVLVLRDGDDDVAIQWDGASWTLTETEVIDWAAAESSAFGDDA